MRADLKALDDTLRGGGRAAPLLACTACGTLHKSRGIPHGSVATCRVCRTKLFGDRRGSLQAVLALNVTALLIFVAAHLYPFISITYAGSTHTATLLTGAAMLASASAIPLAVLVAAVGSAIPAARMVATIWALGPLTFGRLLPGSIRALRLMHALKRWSMLEILFLGILVAYVKMSSWVTIDLHAGIIALAAVIVLTAAADAIFERRAAWERIGRQNRFQPDVPTDFGHMIACESCGQIETVAPLTPEPACSRCGTSLHRRKPASLARTWALVAAAAILYIPANVLPITIWVYFGLDWPDTIFSGVVALAASGELPIAALVFAASLMVPILKLLALAWLLVSVQRGWLRRKRARTLAYLLIEGIGRWSMVDIFMLSLLVALVHFGPLSTILPGPGAPCFAAVVILTMLASASFDPRLIWDAEPKPQQDRRGDHV